MTPTWTLRQLLAILRRVALMIALFWALILLQLVPAFLRGGLAGLRDHIVQVATAGVPPQHWDIAVTRMYLALSLTPALGFALYLAQRLLGRRLASRRESNRA